MNKGLITLGVIGLLVLLLFSNGCNSYNSMVTKDREVTAAWQQVENVYQRRMDLIPNIVQTVQGEADFEKSTLTAVQEARSEATKVTIDASKLDENSLQKFEQAQGSVGLALNRLMAVAENYPDLKSNQAFHELRVELEGTENRIAEERRKFTLTVQDYNTYIHIFPRNIWAGMFHFEDRAGFHMQEGADKAPQVKFDFKNK